jgi:nucleoside-diphosphate-sugar epimerase
MNLVVGATGQLGSLVVHELRRQGRPVRARVRPPDLGRDLVRVGAELVEADLRHTETMDDALRGVHAVVATDNAVAPLHLLTGTTVERHGVMVVPGRATTRNVARVFADVLDRPVRVLRHRSACTPPVNGLWPRPPSWGSTA